ncbi:MAG: hypothetical protein IPH61_11645 [Bacteroidetes bacterium]|nr:hypothetical protein [Bacteroidota bacterium]MBK8682739.1 hypothetical protein [Bacteroidota bacterium]
MKKHFLYFTILFISVLATAQTEQLDLCNDLKEAATIVNDPDGFKKGEARPNDMWIYYDCNLTFQGATRSEVHYFADGKLSNVLQYFGETLSQDQALTMYDQLANDFRKCYSAIKVEPGALGLRNDLSFQIHDNMIARLAIYYGEPSASNEKTYKVFFDLYYLGE